MAPTRFPVAAVQLCAGADKTENLARIERFTASAAAQGARLVVLPEVCNWRGERGAEADAAEPIPGPTTECFSALARRLGIYLLAGSILETSDTRRPFNTSLLFDPSGALRASYRKIHLFDVDIPGHVSVRESDQRRAGDSLVVCATELGAIGMSICYDLRFPELYRQLTLRGAEIVVVPAAFTFSTGAAHWEVLLRARAIENQVYLVAADQIGRSASGVVDFGHSLIVDPWGTVIARAPDQECVIVADVDRDYQAQVRRQLPCLTHVRLTAN